MYRFCVFQTGTVEIFAMLCFWIEKKYECVGLLLKMKKEYLYMYVHVQLVKSGFL